MRLKHPAISEQLYKLIDVYELGMTLGTEDDPDEFTVRLELFRSMADERRYYCKALRTELVNLQPTFPFIMKNEDGSVEESGITDNHLVDFNQPRMEVLDSFEADSPEDALKKVLGALDDFMEHVSGQRINFS